jgi:hypothetical protein
VKKEQRKKKKKYGKMKRSGCSLSAGEKKGLLFGLGNELSKQLLLFMQGHY